MYVNEITPDTLGKKSYTDLQKVYSARTQIILSKYSDLIFLAEEGIALNYNYGDNIYYHNFLEHEKNGTVLQGYTAFPPFVFQKGIQYLDSALYLSKTGYIEASFSCIRSAVECIWLIYYLKTCPKEAGELYYKWQSNETSVTKDELKLLRDIYRFFSPNHMRLQLYSSNKLQHDNFYKLLSIKSHPTPIGILNHLNFNDEDVKQALELISLLSVSMLVSASEISFPVLKHVAEQIDSYEFKVGEKFHELADLIPDNPQANSKLNVKTMN